MEILFEAKYFSRSSAVKFSGINHFIALASLPPGRYL